MNKRNSEASTNFENQTKKTRKFAAPLSVFHGEVTNIQLKKGDGDRANYISFNICSVEEFDDLEQNVQYCGSYAKNRQLVKQVRGLSFDTKYQSNIDALSNFLEQLSYAIDGNYDNYDSLAGSDVKVGKLEDLTPEDEDYQEAVKDFFEEYAERPAYFVISCTVETDENGKDWYGSRFEIVSNRKNIMVTNTKVDAEKALKARIEGQIYHAGVIRRHRDGVEPQGWIDGDGHFSSQMLKDDRTDTSKCYANWVQELGFNSEYCDLVHGTNVVKKDVPVESNEVESEVEETVMEGDLPF